MYFRIDWKVHTIGRQLLGWKISLLLTGSPKEVTVREVSPVRKQAAIVNERNKMFLKENNLSLLLHTIFGFCTHYFLVILAK